MNGPQITVVGNVGGNPRLRSLADGTFVADFRVAMTPSRFDRARESWVDQRTEWFSVTCWRSLAENVSLSCKTGDKVIVTGTFSTRTWKDKDGVDRVTSEIDAVSVGVDLTRGPVLQKRMERTTATATEETGNDWENGQVDTETGEVIPEQASAETVAA